MNDRESHLHDTDAERTPPTQLSAPDADDAAVEHLKAWSCGYEYYADAYVGPDAAFPDKRPTAESLCEIVQSGARLVGPALRAKDEQIASLRARPAEAEKSRDMYRQGMEDSGVNKQSALNAMNAEADRADRLAAEIVAQYPGVAEWMMTVANGQSGAWENKRADDLAAQVEILTRERNDALTAHSDQKLIVERLKADLAAMTERAEKWKSRAIANCNAASARLDEIDKYKALADKSYIPQDIALEICSALEAVGMGKPGKSNTVLAMVHEIVAFYNASCAEAAQWKERAEKAEADLRTLPHVCKEWETQRDAARSEADALAGLLREIEVPGVEMNGAVFVNYDLKADIDAALAKHGAGGSASSALMDSEQSNGGIPND